MKPAERYDWIESYMRKFAAVGGPLLSVDVLDSDFVDEYVAATGARSILQFYGADKCPQLGRDLSAMFKAKRLKRHATGLWNMAGMGFPRWAYVYSLPTE